ncbi:ketoacyl-ACP synthase III [Cohnella fermenti]|uniref:Beta-ketoacyl-[acyl-carrier-protein] synthase III n=1 Tax=Cohnella fermenti TaxID=2565925 RepID=A0A4S4BG50_9BACL|nr:ketoacyl-ACP synthase III [Cohnella fermenti]THF73372.1 ketoacyl-ACP synthase III [Cohnella fermenti]
MTELRAEFGASITAIGSYAPERRLTNEDLSRMVDTNDEWIVRRTGIKERRIAAEGEYSSDLAILALRNLLERYAVDAMTIDGIIVATTTPDSPFPSVASRVQAAFGMKGALAFDMNAACAGFVSALQVANGLLLTGAYRRIAVIGVETLSRLTDYSDRSTCILFGDGAGVVLVDRAEKGAFLASDADTNGAGGAHVYAAGLSDLWRGEQLAGDGKIVQNGREVYKWAVSEVPLGVERLLARAGLPLERLDWFVPHSANRRMTESMCERLGLPSEKALISMESFGNTSSASIPLALDGAVKEDRLKPGDLLALYGFGSGLSQAGLLLEWTI